MHARNIVKWFSGAEKMTEFKQKESSDISVHYSGDKK